MYIVSLWYSDMKRLEGLSKLCAGIHIANEIRARHEAVDLLRQINAKSRVINISNPVPNVTVLTEHIPRMMLVDITVSLLANSHFYQIFLYYKCNFRKFNSNSFSIVLL